MRFTAFFVGLYILCVKMKTFQRVESVLRHYKRYLLLSQPLPPCAAVYILSRALDGL